MNHQEGSTRLEEVVVRGVVGFGRDLLDQPRSHDAFLGISLDKSISERHLGKYIQWALDHCRHCPVLIDDIEFRHNYIVFDGMDEEQATNKALHKGLYLGTRISGIIAAATYPYKGDRRVSSDDHRGHGVWVNRSSEKFGTGLIASILNPLTQAYEDADEFRQGVDAQVERSMSKKLALWRDGVKEEEYTAGKLQLAKFVLEETAIAIDYIERGYASELYTGDPIQVVVGLYDPQTNKYPNLREILNLRGQYGHINLGIEQTPQR